MSIEGHQKLTEAGEKRKAAEAERFARITDDIDRRLAEAATRRNETTKAAPLELGLSETATVTTTIDPKTKIINSVRIFGRGVMTTFSINDGQVSVAKEADLTDPGESTAPIIIERRNQEAIVKKWAELESTK